MSGIGNIKTENFDATEDDFHNPLYQKMGTTKEELRSVIRDRFVPEVFPDVATEQIY